MESILQVSTPFVLQDRANSCTLPAAKLVGTDFFVLVFWQLESNSSAGPETSMGRSTVNARKNGGSQAAHSRSRGQLYGAISFQNQTPQGLKLLYGLG